MNRNHDNHPETSPDLTALALNELPPDEQRAWQVCIDSDPRLADEIERLRRLGQLVRAASDSQLAELASQDAASELLAAIDDEFTSSEKRVGKESMVTPAKFASRFRARVRLAALAATLLLAAGIGFTLYQSTLDHPIEGVAGLNGQQTRILGGVWELGDYDSFVESNTNLGGSMTGREVNKFKANDFASGDDKVDGGSVESLKRQIEPGTSSEMVLGVTPNIIITADDSEPTVPLPSLADTTITSTEDVPDGGSTTMGGIRSNDGNINLNLIDGVETYTFDTITGEQLRGEQLRIGSKDQDEVLAVLESERPADQLSFGDSFEQVGGLDVVKQAIDLYPDSESQKLLQDYEAELAFYDQKLAKLEVADDASAAPEKRDSGDREAATDAEMSNENIAYWRARRDNLRERLERLAEIRRRLDEYRQRQQHSSEQYELPPENSFRRPIGNHALTTFSIDVDTASYANVRRFITGGQLPPPAAVRIEEMINYFSYDYPHPTDARPFAVHLEVAACPWQPAHKLVRVGLKGREIPRDDRPPSNLVFLIDVSGSMSSADKLPLLQRAMLLLVDQLTENDRVSIVTYANDAGVRLEPVSGDQKQRIRDVINGLSAGGSTHGSAGIQTAYDLAARHFIEEGTNRVLLATDGDLNVGVTSDDDLVRLIKSEAERGIFLSVFGFGTGNLKDAKLEKIADNGNGQYAYIDSIREAQKVLVAEMSGTLLTIARDVKLQIEFNPAEVAAYRLIGYENRALRNEDFANDRVDAGDIGAGHTVTALYEIVPTSAPTPTSTSEPAQLRYQTVPAAASQPAPVTDESLTDAARDGELMMLSLRYKQPEAQESELMEVPVQDAETGFDQASRDFRFAASVAAFGMKLRQSRYGGTWQLSEIENSAASSMGDDPGGHRAELVDLVRQVRQLAGQ